jgi:hypothetical protein
LLKPTNRLLLLLLVFLLEVLLVLLLLLLAFLVKAEQPLGFLAVLLMQRWQGEGVLLPWQVTSC